MAAMAKSPQSKRRFQIRQRQKRRLKNAKRRAKTAS